MRANDAVANDAKSIRCWVAAKQRIAIIDKTYASQENDAKLTQCNSRYRDH